MWWAIAIVVGLVILVWGVDRGMTNHEDTAARRVLRRIAKAFVWSFVTPVLAPLLIIVLPSPKGDGYFAPCGLFLLGFAVPAAVLLLLGLMAAIYWNRAPEWRLLTIFPLIYLGVAMVFFLRYG